MLYAVDLYTSLQQWTFYSYSYSLLTHSGYKMLYEIYDMTNSRFWIPRNALSGCQSIIQWHAVRLRTRCATWRTRRNFGEVWSVIFEITYASGQTDKQTNTTLIIILCTPTRGQSNQSCIYCTQLALNGIKVSMSSFALNPRVCAPLD